MNFHVMFLNSLCLLGVVIIAAIIAEIVIHELNRILCYKAFKRAFDKDKIIVEEKKVSKNEDA